MFMLACLCVVVVFIAILQFGFFQHVCCSAAVSP